MPWILVAALLTAGPEAAVPRVAPQQASAVIEGGAQTGTLIVSQGDCLAVKVYSASRYTHVAAVVKHDGALFIYDATGGAGVRKQTLPEYVASQKDHTLFVFQPRKPFSKEQGARFEQHLEGELGRPYAIHHHVTGKRARGVHCSEYVTDALAAADLMHAQSPPRVSPATLVKGIVDGELYDLATTMDLVPVSADRPEAQSWCSRLWFDTKQCTRSCCSKCRGWFCCK